MGAPLNLEAGFSAKKGGADGLGPGFDVMGGREVGGWGFREERDVFSTP